MKKSLRARIAWAAVGLVVLAGVVYAFMPGAAAVETAEVTRGLFRETVDHDGKTAVRERFVVSAPLAGILQRVTLKAGDPVEQDQPIASITPNPPTLLNPRAHLELTERVNTAEAARARAGALVARERAAFDQAKVDYERARQLAATENISRAELDQARLKRDLASREFAAAKLQEQAARHQLAEAKAALETFRSWSEGTDKDTPFRVICPVTGQVMRVMRESAGPVDPGTAIMEVADLSDIEVLIDVLSSDAVKIRRDDLAIIEHWGGPPLQGRVRRVEPSAFTKISALGVEEQRVYVRIDITSPRKQWATLGDAYKVDARIVIYSADNAIKVPTGALFRQGGDWAVYVVENGRAHLRPVRIGHRGGTEAQVLGGLKPGEEVVLYPSDKVRDGVAVTTRQSS